MTETGEPDPRLSAEDRESLERMRREVAAAEAAGDWDVEPVEDPEKFDGPVGGDAEGRIATYGSVEELRASGRRARGDDGDSA